MAALANHTEGVLRTDTLPGTCDSFVIHCFSLYVPALKIGLSQGEFAQGLHKADGLKTAGCGPIPAAPQHPQSSPEPSRVCQAPPKSLPPSGDPGCPLSRPEHAGAGASQVVVSSFLSLGAQQRLRLLWKAFPCWAKWPPPPSPRTLNFSLS